MSEIPNIVDEKNIIIARGQGKTPVSILSDEFCEGQAFRHLLPKGEFGFNVPRNIPVSAAPYFIKGYLFLISILHQIQIIFFFQVCV